MKSSYTIGARLMASFGAVFAVALVLGWVSLSSVNTLSNELDRAVGQTAKKIDMAGQISTDIGDMRSGMHGYVMFLLVNNPAASDESKTSFDKARADMLKLSTELRTLLETDEGRQSVDTLERDAGTAAQFFGDTADLLKQGNAEGVGKLQSDRAKPLYDEMEKAAGTIVQLDRHALEDAKKASADTASTSHWLVVVMIVLAVGAGAVVMFFIRQVNTKLRQAVSDLSEGAEQLASAASQVSSSSQSLAQGASEQAASLEETSASSEEINSMASQNSENSRGAAERMQRQQERITEANHSLEQMVGAMNEINTSSEKISKIIKVIDEIAFQTNILALNAAVEAARAGEAGMGFAVVADEVRNLAQRCAQAAKDTASLIEDSIGKSNDGKTKVEQVTAAIRSITEEAEKVKTLVDEVNLGSQEQARGLDQIGKALSQMEQVTQKTAASAEESASASEELNAQSATLREVVRQLTAMVGGSGETRQAGSARRGSSPAARGTKPKAESAFELSRLHTAVAGKPKAVDHHKAEPAPAGVKAGKNPIPLDDDFKEF